MQSRRARKSIEQWSALVDQFDSSTDSMEQFCEQQNLAMSTFQRWRNTILRSKEIGSTQSTPEFAQVTSPKPTPTKTPSAVTLQIGTSITVMIHTPESV